jgi:hypothetical protein
VTWIEGKNVERMSEHQSDIKTEFKQIEIRETDSSATVCLILIRFSERPMQYATVLMTTSGLLILEHISTLYSQHHGHHTHLAEEMTQVL